MLLMLLPRPGVRHVLLVLLWQMLGMLRWQPCQMGSFFWPDLLPNFLTLAALRAQLFLCKSEKLLLLPNCSIVCPSVKMYKQMTRTPR